ncbi:MAG: hypothetical protein Q9178_000301 [Gyalolechia marmorata]
MLAFLLASKALGLAITTVMGLFTYTTLINDGPAKALQAFLTLGLQYHLVGLPTSERHITELSHNSSTVAFSFAPTRTCDSYLHLPAHEQGVNATLPTAHVEQARNLRPQSPLSEQLRVAPLPHGLSDSINVLTMNLPIGIDLCIGFFSLGLVVLIYIIWRNYHVAVEGRARSERQIGSFWVSFVTALASNADTNARLRSLEALHKEVLDHYVCFKMPTASNLISLLDMIMDDLKRHQAKIDLGEIMLPEDESYRKILSLETTVSEITNGRDEVMGKYEALEEKYQEALSGADTLRETSQGFASDNELLQQVNRELSDKNGDLEHQKHNLDSALAASKTECGQVTANLTEFKSQNRELEGTFRAMKSRRDEAVEELRKVSEDREAITRAKETYRMRTERGEEALASSQEEVKRVVAENSRLKTVNRDEKPHQKQEKEAINEQLAKVAKELQDLRDQSKDHQPLSSATKKILESENATLRSNLKQAEQVKKDLLEANEEITDKVRTMEEQLKHARECEQAAQAKATRLEDDAFDRETARMDEDSALRALVIKEQQEVWDTDHDRLVAALEQKWRGTVDALVSEKSTTEMELMKAKEEVDALAKQVTDQLTANPPSSHDAQGMTPSSHLLPLAATFPTDANHPSASFNTSSNHSVQEELRALQKEFSTRTNIYETRIDGLNTAIGQLRHERSMLQSRLAPMGPHPPSGLHMPGVYHHGPGGPVISPSLRHNSASPITLPSQPTPTSPVSLYQSMVFRKVTSMTKEEVQFRGKALGCAEVVFRLSDTVNIGRPDINVNIIIPSAGEIAYPFKIRTEIINSVTMLYTLFTTAFLAILATARPHHNSAGAVLIVTGVNGNAHASITGSSITHSHATGTLAARDGESHGASPTAHEPIVTRLAERLYIPHHLPVDWSHLSSRSSAHKPTVTTLFKRLDVPDRPFVAWLPGQFPRPTPRPRIPIPLSALEALTTLRTEPKEPRPTSVPEVEEKDD